MKRIRSNSDTDIIVDKEYINRIQDNLNTFKKKKASAKKLSYESHQRILSKSTQSSISKEKKFNNRRMSASIYKEREEMDVSLNKNLKMILEHKIILDREYFESKILKKKEYVNIILEIFLKKIENLKNDYLNSIGGMFNQQLDTLPTPSLLDSGYKENATTKINENLKIFQSILEVLINLSPEALFRDVKSLVLTEYESVSTEIINYFEFEENQFFKKQFLLISQSILFVLTIISSKLDIYYLSLNCLVEKLNRYCIYFIEKSSEKMEDNINIEYGLTFINRFIKLKKTFIKNFCNEDKSVINLKEDSDFKLSSNKFNSFGRFFFNNIYFLIQKDVILDNNKFEHKKTFNFQNFSLLKFNSLSPSTKGNRSVTFLENLENKKKLHLYFRLYFTFKLVNWKYTALKTDYLKDEICRICERGFKINHFFLHVSFCKEKKLYNQKIINMNNELSSLLKLVKSYELDKDFVFSPKSNFSVKFKSEMSNKKTGLFSGWREKEIVKILINEFEKEKSLVYENYERNPNKISSLINLIHFTVLILYQNKICISFSERVNDNFSKIFKILMKKMFVIEKLLSLSDNSERTKVKVEKLSLKKLKSLISTPLIKTLENEDLSYPDRISKLSSLTKFNYNDKSRLNSSKNTQIVNEKNKNKTKRFNTINKSGNNNIPQANLMASLLFPNSNFKNSVNNFDLKNLLRPVEEDSKSINRVTYPPNHKIKEIGKELKNFSKFEDLDKKPIRILSDNRLNKFANLSGTLNIESFKVDIIPSSENDLSKKEKTFTLSNSNHRSSINLSPFEIDFTPLNVNDIRQPNNLQEFKSSGGLSSTDGNTNISGENYFNPLTKYNSPIPSETSKKIVLKSRFQLNSNEIGGDCRFTKLMSNYEQISLDESKLSSKDSSMDSDEENFKDDVNDNEMFKNFIITNKINEELNENSQGSVIDDLVDIVEDFEEPEMSNKNGVVIIKNDDNSDGNIVQDYFSTNYEMKISDFKFIKPVGKGGYGRVDIYKKIKTGDIYAIKSVNIYNMKSKNVSGLISKETLIFNEIFSDYVVKCFWIFSDQINIYYVMEYVVGGNLLNFLNKYILKFETIKLIVAEVLLSLHYLHYKNIIHRDIKPENILISSEGHFKLTDFGISEVGLQNNKNVISNLIFNDDSPTRFNKTSPILGTEHYLAPEIIKGENKITNAVDYWSLGVLVYELFTNKLPFAADSFYKTADNILNLNINWQALDNLQNNNYFSESEIEVARDLISKFLVFDHEKRWGLKNFEQIKMHKFFMNLDWNNLKNVKDSMVRKYVVEQIKEVNKNSKEDTIKELEKLKLENNFENNEEIKTRNFIASERVDNLHLACQDVIKKSLKQNTLSIDYGDEKFTDLMNDLLD